MEADILGAGVELDGVTDGLAVLDGLGDSVGLEAGRVEVGDAGGLTVG